MSFRRIVLVALMLTLPAQVYAISWSLSTRVTTNGGSLQVGAAVPQTSLRGTVLKNYTTSRNLPIYIQPDPGYQISSYFINGTERSLPAPNPVNMGLIAYPDRRSQSFSVSFTKPTGSITATALSGGTVSPSGSSKPAIGTTASYTFTPNTGGRVVNILGLPAGASLVATGTGAPVTLPFAAAVTASFTVSATPVTLTGAFEGITVASGAPQIVISGNRANLSSSVTIYDGSPLENVIFSWSQIGGTEMPLSAADTATPYFISSTPGTFTYQVLVTDLVGATATASTSVVVAATPATAARMQCQGCHSQTGIGAASNVFYGWSSSGHSANKVICAYCHIGANTGAHPGAVTSSTVNATTFINNATGQVYCVQCHSPSIPQEFATARHASVITCSACHIDPHTAAAFSSTSFKTFSSGSFQGRVLCFRCHGKVNTTHYFTRAQVDNICSSCHNSASHNPVPFMKKMIGTRHFNGYTSAANPASRAAYVTPRTACTSCHLDQTGFDRFSTQRRRWAGSAHGDTTSGAWKNAPGTSWISTNGCVRCHSAEGFTRFVASGFLAQGPLSEYADQASGPLSCNGCHLPDFQVKTLAPVTIYYNISTAAGKVEAPTTYPEASKSNVCVACHSGSQSGGAISALAARFGNLSGYQGDAVTSHALPVAVTLYGNAYNATPYTQPLLAHDQIGIANNGTGTGDSGPCASCHMGNKDHSYAAVTKDDTGAIRSVVNQSLCLDCHTVMDATTISNAKANFTNGLAVLAQLLINKGYLATYSYGGRIIPPSRSGSWGSSEKFGAWYNIDLLTRGDSQAGDPAAYVHNPAYARKLILNAIDTFDDGVINNSATATIAAITLNPAQITGIPAGLSSEEIKASGTGYVKTDQAGCGVCHSTTLDPRSGNNILADYAASAHPKKAGGPTCASCHAPQPPVPHPAQDMNKTPEVISERCYGCHGDPLGYAIPHTWNAIGLCATCHNGHYPLNITMKGTHFGSYSTAQLVTTNFSCQNCHYENDEQGNKTFRIYSANRQWARSGKGNAVSPSYTAYDFKTMGTPLPATPAVSAGDDCVRCHTTTGYINYVTSNFENIQPWGISGELPGGDRTREMVSCAACHNPTPFRGFESFDPETDEFIPAFTRREVPQVTAYYNYSSPGSGRILNKALIQYDAGISNNCIVCHSGRSAGTTLKKIATKVGAAGSFWSNTPFIDPHTMGAAGIVFAKTGYTYARSYTAPGFFAHATLDMEDQGPCVACHMYTDKKHLFRPVSSASNGTITKIRSFDELCSGCHAGGSLDFSAPANLDAKKQGLTSSLKALAATLATKGISFAPEAAPYFFKAAEPATPYTNWNALKSATLYNGSDLMGAAFNLKLLWSDKGAYAHNDFYAKRLIYDSIDFVDDGVLNNTVFVTIQNLPTGAALGSDDKNRALAYVGVRP